MSRLLLIATRRGDDDAAAHLAVEDPRRETRHLGERHRLRSSGRAGRAAGRARGGPRPRRARRAGTCTESMPSRLTPRNRNGMTVAGRSLPPARPQAATLARYLSWVRIVASVLPPTASIGAGPALAVERPGRLRGERGALDQFGGAEPLQVVAQLRPAGRGDDPVAERRQQRDRDAADPAGGAGDQHLARRPA